MANGRHVGKYSKCHNSPTNGPIVAQLGCSHPIMFSTCPPWCGCHGKGCCLAMAYCTFSSCGRLDAERVNQFCWNLVYNSKLGPQWQSRDQILNWSAIVNIGLSCTIFEFLTSNNIVTLKSGLEVTQSYWNWCHFLFAFCSNCGRICSRLWNFKRQRVVWPWKQG